MRHSANPLAALLCTFSWTKPGRTEQADAFAAGAAEESDQAAASNGTGATVPMPSSIKELHDLKVGASAVSQCVLLEAGPVLC